jgi:hypothetical protein
MAITAGLLRKTVNHANGYGKRKNNSTILTIGEEFGFIIF